MNNFERAYQRWLALMPPLVDNRAARQAFANTAVGAMALFMDAAVITVKVVARSVATDLRRLTRQIRSMRGAR